MKPYRAILPKGVGYYLSDPISFERADEDIPVTVHDKYQGRVYFKLDGPGFTSRMAYTRHDLLREVAS